MLMTNRFQKITAAILAMLLIVMSFSFLFTSQAFAASGDEGYELADYDVRINVNKNRTYDVKTDVTVNIPEDIDELAIQIPNGQYVISDLQCNGSQFTERNSGNNKYIVFTSDSDTSKGEHIYKITYRVIEYAEHNEKSDIFYYNVIPASWEVPISNLRISLTLPPDFDWSDLQYYSGQFGTQDTSDKLSYTVDGDTIVLTGTKIPANYSITFKAEIENGYWSEVLDYGWTKEAAAVIMGIALLAALALWLIGGRSKSFRTSKEAMPAEGISPADIGYLLDGKLRIRDMVAIIIYLGTRGCLRISEYEPKKYRLIKLVEPKDEERYIRGVYNTLFEGVPDGRALEMEDMGPRLRRALKNVELSVESGYASSDMNAITTLSKVLRLIAMITLSIAAGSIPVLADMYQYRTPSHILSVAIGLICLAFLLVLGWRKDTKFDADAGTYKVTTGVFWAAFALFLIYDASFMFRSTGSWIISECIVAFGLAAAYVIMNMRARGKGNEEVVRRIFGLRNYIATCQPRDVLTHMNDNDDYYYEIFPYAFLFSLQDKWAKTFRMLGVRSADWYSDDISGHEFSRTNRALNTTEVARDITTFSRTIEGEYHAMLRSRRIRL